MLEVRTIKDGMEIDAFGNIGQLGQDLINVCEKVIQGVARNNEDEALILRVWVSQTLALKIPKEANS